MSDIKSVLEQINKLSAQIVQDIAVITTSAALYELKVKTMGKQGAMAEISGHMAKASKEDKPMLGKALNEFKQKVEGAFEVKKQELETKELNEKLKAEHLDLTLPGTQTDVGNYHPIQVVLDQVIQILSKIGYAVRTGPQIEKDWFNFEALNIPADHPARDMQDTFYIDESHVLRTHTSPIQIHAMMSEQLPLRVMAPGSVFRCDSDVSHSPNFHQIEGLLIDKNVSMADLKGTVAYLIRELFGPNMKVRFRPSFFPFTEPSAEFDCSCPMCSGKGCRMCKQSGWIEIGGCGLVHPNVLKAVKIDPEQWQGFAFGFGIERMAIIQYGIEDIRLFAENDKRFLEQLKI